MYNNIDVIKFLIDKKSNLNIQNNYERTPLHLACDKPEVLTLLLDQGANPNIQDDRGETPIIRAAWNVWEKSIKLLLENKADPYIQTKLGRIDI